MASLAGLTDSSVFPWVALAFGLCVGSFLNVVIHRLPKMLEREWREQCAEMNAGDAVPPPSKLPAAKPERYNLIVPRSACPQCGHKITALENIPLISYAVLRGKCSACGTRISPRYPLVELAAGLASSYAAVRFGFSAAGFGAMVFAWALIALAVIDYDTQLLPDDITLPLLWAGLLANLGGTFAPLGAAVIGAAAGYLTLWGVALMVLVKHGRDKPIPFGPYLAAAGFITLFWGEAISRRYLTLLS